MGTARCQFTNEFKQEAVGLLASSGRPLSQIAQESGICRFAAAGLAEQERRGAALRLAQEDRCSAPHAG